MVHNPITEEIRDIRHRLAAQLGNDVRRIGAELRRRQAASGRRLAAINEAYEKIMAQRSGADAQRLEHSS